MRALLAIGLGVTLGCSATLEDPPAPGGGQTAGSCRHIDVVLAVDNSGSTQKEQQALRDAFPELVSQLLEVAGDFRLGLVDGCAQSAAFHTRGTTGTCNFDGNRPWIDSHSPRLLDELRCVASIDSRDTACRGNNDDEQPASTAAAALEPAWASGDRPNAGFGRDDAMLLVVAVTDEDEQPVPVATAQAVHDRLVATKRDADRVVFLGAGGASDCDGPYGDARDADTLQDITARFGERGVFWDLCGGRLDAGLRAAVAALEAACD